MRIAILHHHLEPGGVTSAITRASRLLTSAGIDNVVLTSSTGAPADIPHRNIPFLAYGIDEPASDSHTDALIVAATSALGGPPDLWHIHNHSLGKSRLYAELPAHLAKRNIPVLFHLHDLCENGRPQNLPNIAHAPCLYPLAPHVHYAFLNTRDREIFIHHGLPPERAHHLPNCYSPSPQSKILNPQSQVSPHPLVLYPTRAIRRKNLGELLLLALLARTGTRFATTLAPQNPADLAIHNRWRDFSEKLGLSIEFAVVDRIPPDEGADRSFAAWCRHATHFLTTSIEEGFGMAFIEAAALGKPLIGRSIPRITADLTRQGLQPGTLYESIRIPASWIDPDLLDHFTRQATKHSPNPHNTPLLQGEYYEYSNLPEPLQEDILLTVAADSNRRAQAHILNPTSQISAPDWLSTALATREPSACDLTPWSPETHLHTLRSTYVAAVSNRQAHPTFQISNLKSQIAFPFHFLKSPDPRNRPAPDLFGYDCIIFDIYGTLLQATAGGVKPDPEADPTLLNTLVSLGIQNPPTSPSTALHDAVLRHHTASPETHPEVDLRILWREVLKLPPDFDTSEIVIATEAAWHPATWLPGARETLHALAAQGTRIGLLSNAQCNTLPSLGETAPLFDPQLTFLSYQHLCAKPSPKLFSLLAARLESQGISPSRTLYIGNDPAQDIIPASRIGLQTALYTGHPSSHRPGQCFPDFILPAYPLPGGSGEMRNS